MRKTSHCPNSPIPMMSKQRRKDQVIVLNQETAGVWERERERKSEREKRRNEREFGQGRGIVGERSFEHLEQRKIRVFGI